MDISDGLESISNSNRNDDGYSTFEIYQI